MADAEAKSVFRDGATLTLAGRGGEHVKLRARILHDVWASLDMNANSGAEVVFSEFVDLGRVTQSAQGTLTAKFGGTFVSTPEFIEAEVVLGNGFGIDLFIDTRSLAHVEDFASGGLALAWGGIQSVTDLAGNPLDFQNGNLAPSAVPSAVVSVTSDSGIDYTRAYSLPETRGIPEPSALTLIAVALSFLFVRARGRQAGSGL